MQDFEKVWSENIKHKLKQVVPLKKMMGLNERLDDIMILVAKETGWTQHDMLRMDAIRFMRVVETVKKIINDRINSTESGANNPQGVNKRHKKT